MITTISSKQKGKTNSISHANGFNKIKLWYLRVRDVFFLNSDALENLKETRSRNRRVDLFLILEIVTVKGIYNFFKTSIKLVTAFT
jgi:hypothetical protein